MEYSHLTTAHQRHMLEERIRQLESEHYAHELNKASLRRLPDGTKDKTEGLAQVKEAQGIIEHGIHACRDELAALPEPEDEEQGE